MSHRVLSGIKSLLRRTVYHPTIGARPVIQPGVGELYDVTDGAADIDLSALDVLEWAPCWMTRAERLLLFTLAYSLRPQRYLEIGTFRGGSALIVTAAMDSADNAGTLTCIDPDPRIAPEHLERIEHRATILAGSSPDILPEAYETAGGEFDLVLIDGDHSAEGVVRDGIGVLPYVAEGGYILFHDSFFPEVDEGIRRLWRRRSSQLVDCGTLTRETTVQQAEAGEIVRWGGLRLMQVRRPNSTSG